MQTTYKALLAGTAIATVLALKQPKQPNPEYAMKATAQVVSASQPYALSPIQMKLGNVELQGAQAIPKAFGYCAVDSSIGNRFFPDSYGKLVKSGNLAVLSGNELDQEGCLKVLNVGKTKE